MKNIDSIHSSPSNLFVAENQVNPMMQILCNVLESQELFQKWAGIFRNLWCAKNAKEESWIYIEYIDQQIRFIAQNCWKRLQKKKKILP